MKKLIVAAGFAALVSSVPLAGVAQDKKADSPHSLAGNLSLVSEYRYRGISQTDFRPAVQGGFDYAHSNGFYAGVWGSNISWLADAGAASGSSVELDLYAGFKNTVGEFSYDVGVLQYYYPGNFGAWTSAGNPKPNTTELYIAGSWKMFTLKYSHAVTDLFGVKDSDGSNYVDLSANFDVGAGVTLGAHAGHQKVRNASDCSYSDWKVGASKDFAGFAWGLNYVDTNAKDACYLNYRNKNLGKGAVVLSVGKTF